VTRGVDEVELVGVAVLGGVVELYRTGLDGDAALTLQVHVVQQLALHVPLGHGVALLNQPVGKGGLSVVYVCNDGKVSDFGLIGHKQKTSGRESPNQSPAER